MSAPQARTALQFDETQDPSTGPPSINPPPIVEVAVEKIEPMQEVVNELDVKFIGDTWLELDIVKFEPGPLIDPRQQFEEDDSFDEDKFIRRQVVGVRLASAWTPRRR